MSDQPPVIPAISSRAWPLKVHGPLDTPAMQHNKALELDAARILRSALSGPSARYDAEAVLVALGWPELAIRLAKGEDIGPAGQADLADRDSQEG
jgi:hypothetical protein